MERRTAEQGSEEVDAARRLHIALEEGFFGDEVVVRVGGREAFRSDAVRTRLQIGLAASLDVDVQDNRVVVEIELPKTGARWSEAVAVDGAAWLGVSLDHGNVVVRRSSVPFGYA